MLLNLDPPIFTRPAAQAVDQGVPVVALDTAPTAGSKVDFYVGNDNYELGGLLAAGGWSRGCRRQRRRARSCVGVPDLGTSRCWTTALGASRRR